MKDKNTGKIYDWGNLPNDQTDWATVKKLTEQAINTAGASDPAVRILTDKELNQFKRVSFP